MGYSSIIDEWCPKCDHHLYRSAGCAMPPCPKCDKKEEDVGVLPCDREGCENIMCDRIIPERLGEYGMEYSSYICSECFEELVESGPDTDLEKFMGRKPFSTDRDHSLEYWNKRIHMR